MPKTISDLLNAPRLVVKVGSSLLVDPAGAVRTRWLARFAEDIRDLKRKGQDIVIVSSGAIALGAARLHLDKGGRGSLADAQAAASVGQIGLASLWSEMLGAHGLIAAQLLITLSDLEDRRRYLNAAATLARLLEAGAIPVINENDSIATEEIRFGDNDRLAARVAQVAQAQAVALLSDVDGLYDGDPRSDNSRLIPLVERVTPDIMEMAVPGIGSGIGSGGMASKLEAAQIADRAGIPLAIINGTHEAPLSRAASDARGTIFAAQRGARARQVWLGGRLAPAGTLTVDAGCAAALADGASLLAAGITGIEGEFRRGDLVVVVDTSGRRMAQGLAEYGAQECRTIMGLSQGQQAVRLGYAPRAAVVHRDHMVLL